MLFFILTRYGTASGCSLARQTDKGLLVQPPCTDYSLRYWAGSRRGPRWCEPLPQPVTPSSMCQAAAAVHASSAEDSFISANATDGVSVTLVDSEQNVSNQTNHNTDADQDVSLNINQSMGSQPLYPTVGGTTGEDTVSEAIDSPSEDPAATASTDAVTSSGDAEIPAGELLRRQRISKANKGKVPWNKGKKHSPDTIAKIRASTLAAMKRPEVLQKVLQAPHLPHSDESRAKIKLGVSKRAAERRLEKLRNKESCDGAAAKAVQSQKQQKAPDAQSATQTAQVQKTRTQKRTTSQDKKRSIPPAELTPEQVMERKEAHRKAISEAIKRKWQDPEYRAKIVCSIKSEDVQAVRTTKWKTNREERKATARKVARQMIDIADSTAEELEAIRQAKVAQARVVVEDAEASLHSLHAQLSAFASDPAMQQRAQEAIRSASAMLKLAKSQMKALQEGQPIPQTPPKCTATRDAAPNSTPAPYNRTSRQHTAAWNNTAGPDVDYSSLSGFDDDSSTYDHNGDAAHAAANDFVSASINGVYHPITSTTFNGISSRIATFNPTHHESDNGVNGDHISSSAAVRHWWTVDADHDAVSQTLPSSDSAQLGTTAGDFASQSATESTEAASGANGPGAEHVGARQSANQATTQRDSRSGIVQHDLLPRLGVARASHRPQAGGRVVSVRMSQGGPRVRGSGTPPMSYPLPHNGTKYSKATSMPGWAGLIGNAQGSSDVFCAPNSSGDDGDDLPIVGRDNYNGAGEYMP